jgi:hypothetical protein
MQIILALLFWLLYIVVTKEVMMIRGAKYWVRYYVPGFFLGDSYDVDITEARSKKPEEIEFSSRAYAFSIHKRMVLYDAGDKYLGEPQQIGKTYYHPASFITTLEQLQYGNYPKGLDLGRCLVSNMECNKWQAMIWTRWSNWPQPYDPELIEILPKASYGVMSADQTYKAIEEAWPGDDDR